MIILGNLLITGAYAFITVPNEIINGGVTSFSMVLGQVCRMDISVFVNLLTLFLLFLCLVFLGREFFAGSVLSCVCYLSMFTFFHSLGLYDARRILLLSYNLLLTSWIKFVVSANVTQQAR